MEADRLLINEAEGSTSTSSAVLSSIRIQGSRWMSLISACLVLLIGTGNLVVLGTVIPLLKAVFHLSSIQSNALLASPLLVAGLCSVPVSLFSQRHGARWITALLCLLCVVSLLSMAAVLYFQVTVGLYPIFFICGALLGSGALSFNSLSIQVAYWTPMNGMGFAYAVLFFGYSLGPPLLSSYSVAFAQVNKNNILYVFILFLFVN